MERKPYEDSGLVIGLVLGIIALYLLMEWWKVAQERNVRERMELGNSHPASTTTRRTRIRAESRLGDECGDGSDSVSSGV